MESGEIPSSALKSSSDYNQYFTAERSRLNEKKDGSYYGGWASKHADVGQWLQIDLGKTAKITRIATQGRYDANWWVTKYRLTYSDGGIFKSYKNGQVSILQHQKKSLHHHHHQCSQHGFEKNCSRVQHSLMSLPRLGMLLALSC